MLRSVRLSLLAVAVVIALLSMQGGVVAKKRILKRKKSSQRAPLVLVLPTFTSAEVRPSVASAPDVSTAPSVAPVAQKIAAPTTNGAVGDGEGSEKAAKGTRIDRTIPLAPHAGSLIISEFRLQGPNGAGDEYIEIYNDSGADHTVAPPTGTGYAVAASDGIVRCTIPAGTIIPARGHYLCTNSGAGGYSLGSYPAGNGNVTTGDATYTTQITNGEDPDGAGPNPPTARQGIALFNNNSGGGSFSLANRFDAVGPVEEANTLYKEGTGLPNLTFFSIDYAFVRDECGKGGSISVLGPCTISTPKDTDDNAADFYFVDTNGTSAGAGQRLGSAGPQSLSSAIQRNSTITENMLDATVSKSNPPNRVRDFTSVPAQNSTFGTISIRRRFVNNTGASITSLRFRIIDITTFPNPAGIADMRARTSTLVVVAGINDPATCLASTGVATTPCVVNVQGTTLDQPPSQPNGGAFNSSLTAGTVTLGTPLANGASINVQFLFGLQATGNFKVYVNIEALP